MSGGPCAWSMSLLPCECRDLSSRIGLLSESRVSWGHTVTQVSICRSLVVFGLPGWAEIAFKAYLDEPHRAWLLHEGKRAIET